MYAWVISVKCLRDQAGLTQKEVAEKIGIDLTKYGRIERNPERCSAKDADRIAEFYNVPVEVLFKHLIRRSPFPSECLLRYLLGTRKWRDRKLILTLEDLKNRGMIDDGESLSLTHQDD